MHLQPRHAFTLIEMMIAVALGSLVVYIATAGIRTAAQSVASANRLALENSILRKLDTARTGGLFGLNGSGNLNIS